jgi:molecular chaperone DnaK
MSVAIGIDLGTTNTVVAAVVDGVAVTLEDEQGRRLLPSVVSFHPSSTVLVGEPARERRLIDPENTIFSIKPLLGRPWDSDEVQAARSRFPFQLAQGAKNSTMVVARDVAYALPEISAFVLRRAKAIAEAALGQAVDRAVITVPANFNDLQRASTKVAGKLAGLDVMRILNEPTAAALAYGQSISKAEKIAVYDLGGGTFDVTLLDLTGNVFEVLATAGDTALGGDDIDRVLADRIAIEVLRRFNVDPRTNPAGMARLLFIAEELKKELSNAYQAQREITDVGWMEGGHPISMPFVLTRDDLEVLAKPLIERTLQVAKHSMDLVGLTPRDFDRVILVGGSTRMPIVSRMVEQLFGQPPHLRVNPDEVVALGAAIQAHALNRSKSAHKRRSAHDQLAKAQPKATGEQIPTRPPEADPTVAPADVPKAPPLPRVDAPAPPPAPPAEPEFFTLNKAPAVISFEVPDLDVPPAPPALPARPASEPRMPAAPASSQPRMPAASPASEPRMPAAPPPVPAKKPPPLPTAPKRGMSDHAAPVRGATASMRSIAGSRVATPVDDVVGPKPARPAGPWPPAALDAIGDSDVLPAPELEVVPPTPTPSTGPVGQTSGSVSVLPNYFQSFELGAAVFDPTPERFQQGSAITTSAATPLLIDVTPLSLGVETAGGYSDVLIPANSPVPCEKTRTFLTARDNQTTVSIRVAQGESSRFAENTHLGDLELSGLRPARRGEVKIAVTFELDADGILNVRARDQDTGRETTATMRLLGANTDAEDVRAMAERQARHVVA